MITLCFCVNWEKNVHTLILTVKYCSRSKMEFENYYVGNITAGSKLAELWGK